MGTDFVAQQQAFWKDTETSRKHLHVTARTTIAQVVEALARPTTEDQILYFYCHAESVGLTASGGPDTSCLVLTERFLDGEPLGDAFLGLRQEFLHEHGNPLGLLYAVHCDGDTQIVPALPIQNSGIGTRPSHLVIPSLLQ